ncbi:MAG: hypothetical protein IIY93_12930 [Clostridia bacterium]|nr:hypothetical protein [Clostridia bacterium]
MNDTRDRKISELTIADITERMLQFAMCSELVDASDFPESYNEGISDALTEMRRDMDTLTERQFISKYEEASLEKGDELISLDEDDERVEYIQGYCSTVDDVLHMIDPTRLYDEMRMMQDGMIPNDGIDEDFIDRIFED